MYLFNPVILHDPGSLISTLLPYNNQISFSAQRALTLRPYSSLSHYVHHVFEEKQIKIICKMKHVICEKLGKLDFKLLKLN